MAIEKTYIPSTDITEENVFSKPKCQAILSIIAHFQQNKKNIQRAHLIRALVKNADPNSLQKDFETGINKKMLKSEEHLYNTQTITKKQNVDDKNLLEKSVIDRLQALADITPKIMFNSIANLDKTVQYLRKLGLITNQYIRGYPRIILTDKGLILFYRYIIKRMVDELVHDGSQLMSISNHILTSFIPKEKKKNMAFALPEFYFPEKRWVYQWVVLIKQDRPKSRLPEIQKLMKYLIWSVEDEYVGQRFKTTLKKNTLKKCFKLNNWILYTI